MSSVHARLRALTRYTAMYRAARITAHTAALALTVSALTAAAAGAGDLVYLAVNDLPTVINGIQNWIMGILAAVATCSWCWPGLLRHRRR